MPFSFARLTRSMLVSLAVLSSSGVSSADPTLAGVAIALDPPLPVISRGPRGDFFSADGDETVQLTVVATYSDGSSADVTERASFESLSPASLGVTPAGQVTLSGSAAAGPIGVEVSYGGRRHLVVFTVTP
jgi:hypothetical protein